MNCNIVDVNSIHILVNLIYLIEFIMKYILL
jgi:hypothetical protein